ncbi:MAG: molybdopterin-dependent oxidoreductase, partial [Acetobacteraceae bacterium]|nr:molybdopterin-dependent oxidoreductase [Acetobacteraceae bacterium]
DSGVDLGIEHAFERSMPVADAMRDEVMLAWAANGQKLLPEHGFPLRLARLSQLAPIRRNFVPSRCPEWRGKGGVLWDRPAEVACGADQASCASAGEFGTLPACFCVKRPATRMARSTATGASSKTAG